MECSCLGPESIIHTLLRSKTGAQCKVDTPKQFLCIDFWEEGKRSRVDEKQEEDGMYWHRLSNSNFEADLRR